MRQSGLEFRKLLSFRKFLVEQEINHFFKGRVLSQILNQVPAVDDLSDISVNITDSAGGYFETTKSGVKNRSALVYLVSFL